MNMLSKDSRVIDKIKKNDTPIAELEYLGLSLRVINSLEESRYKIIYLKDLFSLSDLELKSIENLGSSGLKQISLALKKLDMLEDEKNKWHGKIC